MCATAKRRVAKAGHGRRDGREDDVLLILHLRPRSDALDLDQGGVQEEWESVHGPGLPGAKIPIERVLNSHA
jgi:hypothetical protein